MANERINNIENRKCELIESEDCLQSDATNTPIENNTTLDSFDTMCLEAHSFYLNMAKNAENQEFAKYCMNEANSVRLEKALNEKDRNKSYMAIAVFFAIGSIGVAIAKLASK